MSVTETPVFRYNLALTQAYCRHLQANSRQTDPATLFRTFNPVVNGAPLFSFEAETYNHEIAPGHNRFTTTQWAIDPHRSGLTDMIDSLFKRQLVFKERQVILDVGQTYEGHILVAQVDQTVTDGASEASSSGLIDVYDLPPIDTWIYLQPSSAFDRLLYAWIPQELYSQANDAILVNCVDCLSWHEKTG